MGYNHIVSIANSRDTFSAYRKVCEQSRLNVVALISGAKNKLKRMNINNPVKQQKTLRKKRLWAILFMIGAD